MSKKYKDKVCVYCGVRQSTTADHVFSREFFLEKHRDALPKAPACNTCNTEKSKLEHYLTTILPMGARHSDAGVNLRTMVPKRLKKNQKLRTHLAQEFTERTIPLKRGQIEKLFVLVAKGLLWHHWNIILGADDCAVATVIRATGIAFVHDVLSRLKPLHCVHANLGEGTFSYEGLQTTHSPQSTLWQFSIYGGLRFSENSQDCGDEGSLILAVTGPRALTVNWFIEEPTGPVTPV